jgi:uncharacterized membrane protein
MSWTQPFVHVGLWQRRVERRVEQCRLVERRVQRRGGFPPRRTFSCLSVNFLTLGSFMLASRRPAAAERLFSV